MEADWAGLGWVLTDVVHDHVRQRVLHDAPRHHQHQLVLWLHQWSRATHSLIHAALPLTPRRTAELMHTLAPAPPLGSAVETNADAAAVLHVLVAVLVALMEDVMAPCVHSAPSICAMREIIEGVREVLLGLVRMMINNNPHRLEDRLDAYEAWLCWSDAAATDNSRMVPDGPIRAHSMMTRTAPVCVDSPQASTPNWADCTPVETSTPSADTGCTRNRTLSLFADTGPEPRVNPEVDGRQFNTGSLQKTGNL